MKITNNMTVFTGIEYIKLAIANTFGKDKESWTTRLLWVEENLDNLLEMAGDADEPYQYIKAVRALEDSCAHIPTGYAVGMDATASGIQIFSCLAGCVKTGAKVNLINDGIRHDAYTDMTNLLSMSIPRADVKEAMMTFFYGSIAVPKQVFGDDTPELQAFIHALQTEYAGAYTVMQVLRSCLGSVHAEYSMTAPDGHVAYIRHSVVKSEEVNVSLDIDGTEEWDMIFDTTVQEHDPRDLSIMANVAHMLDAWLVREVVLKCKEEGFDAYHVHDCYFCSPKHMNKLRRIFREALAHLAEVDYLTQIFREITGEDIDFAIDGSALAKEILKSDYALC